MGFHKSKDGQYRPCQATVRPCLLEHFTRTQLTHIAAEERGRTATEALKEVKAAGINPAKPHWRLHLSKRTNKLTPICLSQFDYNEYEPARIYPGNAFKTVEQAEQAINILEPQDTDTVENNPPATPDPYISKLPPRRTTSRVAELAAARQSQTATANHIRDRIKAAGISYPENWNDMGSSAKDRWEDRTISSLDRAERMKTQRTQPAHTPAVSKAQQIRDRIQKAGVKYPMNWDEMGSSEKDLWEDRIIARLDKLETFQASSRTQ